MSHCHNPQIIFIKEISATCHGKGTWTDRHCERTSSAPCKRVPIIISFVLSSPWHISPIPGETCHIHCISLLRIRLHRSGILAVQHSFVCAYRMISIIIIIYLLRSVVLDVLLVGVLRADGHQRLLLFVVGEHQLNKER